METTYYSLGSSENSRIVKIIQIFFGIICIAVAIFWLVINIRALKTDRTLWITIIFLFLFGGYQILAGSGYTFRFIAISHDNIYLKKNAIFPPVRIPTSKIEKIDFFPLSLVFYLKSQKRIILRFGTMYDETNEKITDELIRFAESNKIPVAVIEEEL